MLFCDVYDDNDDADDNAGDDDAGERILNSIVVVEY